jgi:hypothetical protein
MDIDARPSDAIALALRFRAPIYMAENVIEEQTGTRSLSQWLVRSGQWPEERLLADRGPNSGTNH